MRSMGLSLDRRIGLCEGLGFEPGWGKDPGMLVVV